MKRTISHHYAEWLNHDPGIRRLPKQRRAKHVVESILLSAEELLHDENYEFANTNRIAEKAGIAISSLYEYFSHKQAIYQALYVEVANQATMKLQSQILEHSDVDSVTAMTRFANTLYDIYKENFTVLVKLVAEAPNLGINTQTVNVEFMLKSSILAYLRKRLAHKPTLDLDVIWYFLVSTMMNNLRYHLLNPVAGITRNIFIRESVNLLEGYLNHYE